MVVDRHHELPETPPVEPHQSDGLKNKAQNIGGDEVNVKIQETLKLLNLRDVCTLIQFWSPYSVGKRKLLKTIGQPFGLGIHDERLCSYRRESERNRFHVDEECKEEDLIPVVRVFRQQLPEWTSDVTNYYSKKHPLRNSAISWDLHGYLVLPVFDSLTMSCVGVLETVTSLRYLDCSYEVQEVHRALKEANLTSPQAFDCPTSYAEFKNTQHELDDIFKILKDCCFTHKLPLAQTWKVSSMNSFVATERNIEMSCNSFNSSCIGEVCMSTTGLPFYVHDLRFWPFREACREHHLLKSKGVVGRALSSHGSCFCADVTKLGEHEYSLVHYARMSGLTSCLAIYFHSKKHDDCYVLEFFLPVGIKESTDLQNLVQKLKLHVKSSYFEFGDLLNTELIGMPVEISQCDYGPVSPNKNMSSDITSADRLCADDRTSKKIINVIAAEKGDFVKQRRKRKMDSVTLENIQQYFGKPIGEASKRLGVSRSTLKRVCRNFNIPSWPKPNYEKKNASFGIYVAVFLLVRLKRWSCSSNRHTFSPRWWICGKHNSFAARSNPSPGGKMIRGLFSSSQQLKEPDVSIATMTSFSKPPVARFDKDYKLVDDQISNTLDVLHASASPKTNALILVSDECRMVIVKASYKDDMIKFKFPISSGLMELENQVAQRFKLNNTRLYLKYRDEDDDLILIACDADFHNLMSLSNTSVSNHTIKLIVHVAESQTLNTSTYSCE
ncbi:protein NLP7-like [Bidens hawaiensis]|uniref:protein NLP7-like n=1 Tax=Bidens hawaiensis TaxID=980011 RepID=UPI00404B1EDB